MNRPGQDRSLGSVGRALADIERGKLKPDLDHQSQTLHLGIEPNSGRIAVKGADYLGITLWAHWCYSSVPVIRRMPRPSVI